MNDFATPETRRRTIPAYPFGQSQPAVDLANPCMTAADMGLSQICPLHGSDVHVWRQNDARRTPAR